MKQVAEWALGTAQARGASYAEARVVHERDRALATKNGKIGTASSFESMGAGIRVIADGAWGFAATEELTRAGRRALRRRSRSHCQGFGEGEGTPAATGSGEAGQGRLEFALQNRPVHDVYRRQSPVADEH